MKYIIINESGHLSKLNKVNILIFKLNKLITNLSNASPNTNMPKFTIIINIIKNVNNKDFTFSSIYFLLSHLYITFEAIISACIPDEADISPTIMNTVLFQLLPDKNVIIISITGAGIKLDNLSLIIGNEKFNILSIKTTIDKIGIMASIKENARLPGNIFIYGLPKSLNIFLISLII